MKSTTITALAAAILFVCSAVAVNAQNTNQNQQTPARHHMRANNNNANVTGCLEQGANSGSYTLTAQDGSTWQLTSDAMDLGKYVGKEVSVAGTESATRSSHLRHVSTSQQGNEHGRMDVLDLSVDSETCQR